MPRPLDPDFPLEAVRDALGLVRLLFAVERDGIDLDRPAALVEIGKKLGLSLRLGKCGQDSLGYRASKGHALEALDRLVAVGWPEEVAVVVRMARARVAGEQRAKETDRDLKRKALAARG